LSEYPWYAIVGPDAGLNQGDFIFSCPILEPIHDVDADTVSANYCEYDVVVMSQTCDLVNQKLDIVLVCPFWTLSEIGALNPWFKPAKNKEKLRKGDQPNYHLLNQCTVEGFELDFIVVDFRTVYGVPFPFLSERVQRLERRLRLLSPYKEHLSQAFARFFMRVGLPVDIDPFI
jgi:hypothetical protein